MNTELILGALAGAMALFVSIGNLFVKEADVHLRERMAAAEKQFVETDVLQYSLKRLSTLEIKLSEWEARYNALLEQFRELTTHTVETENSLIQTKHKLAASEAKVATLEAKVADLERENLELKAQLKALQLRVG